MRKALIFAVATFLLAACGTQVPRPSEQSLRAQLEVLLNRAGNSQISWNQNVVNKQLEASLPQGKATSVGWMLEWKPQDGGLAYAIIPWEMLGVADPKVEAELPYGGGKDADKADAAQIRQTVIAGLDPSFRDLVSVHSIRTYGKYAAFSVTVLLPVADDAYGFAEKVGSGWEVRDLGSAEVGCGLVPKKILSEFKVRCSS